tara:strand:+ start:59106 stop:59852 length:747 start_codon:yes stop_codon:yes gene_type:complete
MKKMLLPLAIVVLLGSSCEKESLRPEENNLPGVTTEQIQASPKELQEVRMNEAGLSRNASIVFTPEKNKPAPGLQEVDWKVSYLGEVNLQDMDEAHSQLIEYIVDLQDFLEDYPAEKFYFLGVHKEFITKLQLALVLKQNLETGIQKLNNAELEKARYQMLQKAFEDMDRELEERGMTFKQTEDSIEPVVTIGNSKKKAKRLARALKQYITDGEELLAEANSEYSLLEAGKIEVAAVVLEKINEELNN